MSTNADSLFYPTPIQVGFILERYQYRGQTITMDNLQEKADQLTALVAAQASEITGLKDGLSILAHHRDLAQQAWKDLITQQIEMYESLYSDKVYEKQEQVDFEDYRMRASILEDVECCMSESDFEDIVDFDFDFSHHRGSMEIQTEVLINDSEMQSVIEKIVMHTIDLVSSKLKEGQNNG